MTDIKQQVEARRQEEAAEAKGKDENKITSDFIKKCLYANELGDGALFAALHRGQFVFNKTSLQWFFWKGHHWDMDIMELSFTAIEKVAMIYINEGNTLTAEIAAEKEKGDSGNAPALQSLQKKYFQQAKRLRKTSGAINCLAWAHRIEEPLAINGTELDCKPWLLACQNGVIDLRTGKHSPGKPTDYLYKAVPHDWQGIDCPAPQFEKFLDDIMNGDKELTAYLHRLFGYAVTGWTSEHIISILSGEGRNGKGTLIEILHHVLGTLAEPIQSEMLMEQKNPRSSAGPSPDIMSLKGLRIAFASETDEGKKFSASKAKLLSGGDTLVGRHPNDKHEIRFAPTHQLYILTNHLPHAPSEDYAFWKRIHVIPFNIHFIDDPTKDDEKLRDKNLLEKLKTEASGILAWLVRGCIEWQQQGLNPPPVVIQAIEQYKFNEDILAEFLQECCVVEDNIEIKFPDLYTAFETWWLANRSQYPPKRKKVSMVMAKQFQKQRNHNGVIFIGLALKTEGNRGF